MTDVEEVNPDKGIPLKMHQGFVPGMMIHYRHGKGPPYLLLRLVKKKEKRPYATMVVIAHILDPEGKILELLFFAERWSVY